MRKLLRQKRRHSLSGNKKEPPVLIVKPHRQDCMTNEYTSQFLTKAFKRGIADIMPLASMTADVARNKGIHALLKSSYHAKKTHIFFLDDDSTPCNDFVLERLLSLNKPFVAGVTPIVRKREKLNPDLLSRGILQNEELILDCMWSAIIKNKEGNLENIGIDELPKMPFIAQRTGGTCVLVRRDVLEKLKPPYQKFEWADDGVRLLRSEDIYFTDSIREAGFDIWVDPQSVCHHYHIWDLLDVFAIAQQAKAMGALNK